MNQQYQIITGDCLATLRGIDSGCVQTCVTSPPYFGLRDYGVDGQIGIEATPDEFVAALVAVFREARRVLADDGTLWVNLGDSYAGSGKGGNPPDSPHQKQATNAGSIVRGKRNAIRWGGGNLPAPDGLKPKDLIGIPWRVAFALQADGWYLRQDIIWHKPNPMPESVQDRCTKSHEYIFLLSKSPRYYFNSAAIAEPVADSTIARLAQPTLERQAGSSRVPGKTNGSMKAVGGAETRNKRSVWTVTTKPYKGAHFATFPPDLIEPCILAGSKPGDLVLDPFNGSGTTGEVSVVNGRRYLGIDLNPEYVALAESRIGQAYRSQLPLLTSEAVA